MGAAPQSWVDHFRTIVWIDNLTNQLGLNKNSLDRLYFEKYVSRSSGPDEPVGESDRRFLRYAEGKHVPRPDPVISRTSDGGARIFKLDPLRAMELEAPGSAGWFFHPLFNLMDGRVQSSEEMLKWLERLNPEAELFDELFKTLRAEWRRCARKEQIFDFPDCLYTRSGRHPFSLRMVREEILRLDKDIVNALFQERDGQLYRRPSPVIEEIDYLSKEVSVEGLTAAIGLFVEAELLEAVDRIQPIAALIEHQLPSLEKQRNFLRVSKRLATIIRMGFAPYSLPGYTRQEAGMNGFPASWR